MGLALIKLATTDVENAATQLENKWGPQLHPEERDWIWGVIGRQAAQRLLPEANGHFTKVERDKHLSDELLGWKVRAALRAHKGPDWRNVLEAVNAMSDEGKGESTWVYWKARALLGTANADAQRGGAAAAGIHRLSQGLLRAAGDRGTGAARSPCPTAPLH